LNKNGPKSAKLAFFTFRRKFSENSQNKQKIGLESNHIENAKKQEFEQIL